MKSWNLLSPDPKLSARIAADLGVSDILADLLVNRGIDSPEAARVFLEPDAVPLNDPFLMPGMEGVGMRILEAVARREKVLIHGDYDADGLTATAIMASTLSALGMDVFTFIPDRLIEGYGVSDKAISDCPEMGVSLVITVDCGVSAVGAINLANSMGIDVVVTDHHPSGEKELPPATALTTPHIGNGFPNRDLSGAGVAYHVVRALKEKLGTRVPDFPEVIDLAALGTLGDAMKTTGENRTIIAKGLRLLRDTARPGLLALIDQAGLVAADLKSEAILFQIVPRINALGRMGSASVGLDLLMTNNWAKAKELAVVADETNKKRKRLQEKIYGDIEKRLVLEPDRGEDAGLVFWDENWHRGVIGIVAAKLVEKHNKPAFVLTMEKDGMAYGSARSPDGFDVAAALQGMADILESAGGHSRAGGFHLKKERLEEFRTAVCRSVESSYTPTEFHVSFNVDAEISLDRINTQLIEELDKLEPYGSGNPHPRFLTRQVETQCELQIVGNQHLRLGCHQGPAAFAGIAFGKADLLDSEDLSVIDIVYEPQISRWRGQSKLELRVDDLVPSVHPRRGGINHGRTSGSTGETSFPNLRDCRGRRFPGNGCPGETDIVLFMAGSEETSLAIKDRTSDSKQRDGFLGSIVSDIERIVTLVYDGIGNAVKHRQSIPEPHHVVLWDVPYSRRCLERPLGHTAYGSGSAVVYLAFDEESFERGRKHVAKFHPRRETLGVIYKCLTVSAGNGKVREDDLRKTALREGIDDETYIAAVEVFGEIGILERDGGTVRFLYPTKRRDLTDSPRYRLGSGIIEEHEKLGRFLLRAGLEQIDGYFRGIVR